MAIQKATKVHQSEPHASLFGAGLENEPFTPPTPSPGVFSGEESKFPEAFDPRKASNMPSIEKVNLWMQNIPFSRVEKGWVPDCYPAVASSFSESSLVQFCSQQDDVVEKQAQIITRFATTLYQQESEPVISGDLDEDHAYDHELIDEQHMEEVLGDLFRDRPVFEAYERFGY